ncbi:unnamed protein product [Clavelina lepadiformis]|uniref:phosphoinositide 5-phosphatase n=1 Tax=Clavelina lepadiformis TaxID=159417 RepID=A0ABP0EYE1_CLALP
MYIMKQLRLQIITWNVGGSETINNDQFTKLLSLDKANPVDVYVISLQEIETGFLETAKSFVSYDDWAKLFMSTLSSLGFYLVENVRVQGLSLSVFAHLTHLAFVRFVRTHIVRTGLAGNWGNKGGVAISARVYGEKICILNTHLPAHLEYDEARVEQFCDIIEQMDFDNTLPILSHDVIFWSGDLNFRINDFSRKEILDLIEKKSYTDLLQGDQVII